MRIWDLEVSQLCRKHLLGEHRELHGLWNILVKGHKGYSHHPETKRWIGKLKALYLRHNLLVNEMLQRGYKHNSELDERHAVGSEIQDVFLESVESQKVWIKSKGCDCKIMN